MVMAAAILTATVFQSLGGACEYALTRFDPCGTILANCQPGTFDLLFSDVPNFTLDPTCTIPGQCDDPVDGFDGPFSDFGPGFLNEGP